MTTKRPLDPYREVYINPLGLFVGSLIFAVIFFTVGCLFKHYVSMGV